MGRLVSNLAILLIMLWRILVLSIMLARCLSVQVLPVDPYKIRNSLFATQFMRGPAQASVNVIEREDVLGMQSMTKYQGMLSRTGVLNTQFEQRLAALGR